MSVPVTERDDWMAGIAAISSYLESCYPGRAIVWQPDPERANVWLFQVEGEPLLLAVTADFIEDNAPEPGILYWLKEWQFGAFLRSCDAHHLAVLDDGPGLIRRA